MKRKVLYTVILIFAGFSKMKSLTADELSGALQEKILLPFAELRSSQNFEKANWGAAIFTPQKFRNFPFQFKAGNLTPGGGFSKLNNPLLSSTLSPFSIAKTDVSTITAGLPGISSYTKPISYFAELGYINRKKVFSQTKANCFFNPEDKFPAFSAMQSVKLWKNVIITAAGSAGYFTYEENTFNSWFTTSDFYYHEGKHFCMMPQLSLSVPHFNTLFSCATYESPFGKLHSTYKTENKITAGRYSLNISLFYNENKGIITANETRLKPQVQTKLGLQAKYAVGKKRPVFLKVGLSGYTATNLLQSEKEDKFKLAAGTKVQSPLYCFAFSTLANFTISMAENQPQTNFDSTSFLFSNSWYFKKITPGMTAGVTFSPDNKKHSLTTSEKFGLSAAFFKNPKITAATNFTFTQKDGRSTKQSNTTSVSASWRVKCLSFMGKISLKIEES